MFVLGGFISTLIMMALYSWSWGLDVFWHTVGMGGLMLFVLAVCYIIDWSTERL